MHSYNAVLNGPNIVIRPQTKHLTIQVNTKLKYSLNFTVFSILTEEMYSAIVWHVTAKFQSEIYNNNI